MTHLRQGCGGQALPAYPEYKNSGVEWLGNIPAHWDFMPVKFSLSMPITDGPHETPEKLDDGIPFISAEAVRNNRLDFSKKWGHISLRDHERFSKKYKPTKGDVYMVKSGATTGNVAKVEADEEFNIWSPLAVLRPDGDRTTTDFLHYYMQSKPFRHSVELAWSFGTQQNIGMGVISNLLISSPTPDEQQAIADYLDQKTGQIDALIGKKKELIARLKEQRTAIITHAVTKGIPEVGGQRSAVRMKDSGVEWLGEVPEHWEVRRLKFCASEPLKYGANEAAELDDRDLPRYIRITDVKEDGSLWDDTFRSLPEDIAEPYLLKDGDILLARSGATVGKSFQYLESWGVAAFAGYLIRFRVDKAYLHPRFAYHFLRSDSYWNWINASLIQATIQNVSAEKYASLSLPLPPTVEQRVIADYLDEKTGQIDGLIGKTEEAIQRLEEYRTAVITAAVTGKVKVG